MEKEIQQFFPVMLFTFVFGLPSLRPLTIREKDTLQCVVDSDQNANLIGFNLSPLVENTVDLSRLGYPNKHIRISYIVISQRTATISFDDQVVETFQFPLVATELIPLEYVGNGYSIKGMCTSVSNPTSMTELLSILQRKYKLFKTTKINHLLESHAHSSN